MMTVMGSEIAMRTTTVLCAMGIVVVVLGAASWAQDGWGGMPMVNRATTAAEGAMRGMADVVRSAGAAVMMNSAAAVNVENARAQRIDNRLNATRSEIESRRLKREYRESRRRPRPSTEQIYRLAAEAAPRPLDASQFDPIIGQFTWPTALMMDEFSEQREVIERLFWEKSAAAGRLNVRQMNEVRSATQEMRDLLHVHHRDIHPQLVGRSVGFLRQVDRTATEAGL